MGKVHSTLFADEGEQIILLPANFILNYLMGTSQSCFSALGRDCAGMDSIKVPGRLGLLQTNP